MPKTVSAATSAVIPHHTQERVALAEGEILGLGTCQQVGHREASKTPNLKDIPQQLIGITFVYSLSIRTAVPVTTPKRTEGTLPSDVNICGSGGMVPLIINIEPRPPIWPTHLTPVIT